MKAWRGERHPLVCIPGAMFAGFLSDYLAGKNCSSLRYPLRGSGLLSTYQIPSTSFSSPGFISGLVSAPSSMIVGLSHGNGAGRLARQMGSLFSLGIVSGIFVRSLSTLGFKATATTHGTPAPAALDAGAEIAPTIPLLACLFFRRKARVGWHKKVELGRLRLLLRHQATGNRLTYLPAISAPPLDRHRADGYFPIQRH